MHSTQRSDSTGLAVVRIRPATASDLDALIVLEHQCFHPDLQESVYSIGRSLQSQHQEVWIAEQDGRVLGALFLRFYKNSLRIYSVAVAREAQGRGIGSELMQWALDRATELGKHRLILEAKTADTVLINWYESQGFVKRRHLRGYYSGSGDAWKMVRTVGTNSR